MTRRASLLGKKIVACVTAYGVTKGREYHVVEEDKVMDCVYIINDKDERESYTRDFFAR